MTNFFVVLTFLSNNLSCSCFTKITQN
jgi:hypothetical protein